MVSAGDVWAWVLDCNAAVRGWHKPQVVNYQRLCAELASTGVTTFGELGTTGCRSVLRRYCDAWSEAARRRRAGGGDGFPRRKRRLVPVRWYAGTFALPDDRHARLGLARGAEPLVVTLCRPVPHPLERVRSVELAARNGHLVLTVTAEVPVAAARPGAGPSRTAGVDLGIVHPYAVAGPDGEALLVSGRALRAEHRLHLEDIKARQQQMAATHGARRARAGTAASRGSRRWRTLRRGVRSAEARHRAPRAQRAPLRGRGGGRVVRRARRRDARRGRP